jgi:NAD(P)-dependent dehydrogenase (short-subunit alcohol dehydrogenase family)
MLSAFSKGEPTDAALEMEIKPMLLHDKTAVIVGAGGAVGSEVARDFAREGAAVFLSGRHLAPVENVAREIRGANGTAEAAEVDALDEGAVGAYFERVAREAGSIDILMNVIGQQPQEYGNNTNTLDLPLEQFLLPLTNLVASQFITARAAARHMVEQRSGVILFVTAILSRGFANAAAIGTAFGAMESLLRCLAVDLGPAGVRVVGIRSGAMADTPTIQQSLDIGARRMSVPKEQLVAVLEQETLLKRLPVAADTARLAAFLASDGARALTGAIVNASSGRVID